MQRACVNIAPGSFTKRLKTEKARRTNSQFRPLVPRLILGQSCAPSFKLLVRNATQPLKTRGKTLAVQIGGDIGFPGSATKT